MPTCAWCGKEFDVSTARRICGQRYGAGIYDDYYPEGDVCTDCAVEVMSADYAAGAALKELMHDDDD
ncbi:MAG: hypothetical protein IJM46_03520 [Oscillospiraceae bacterium]|nr:hypothetical protein [Oscillospiraceae bacterium]